MKPKTKIPIKEIFNGNKFLVPIYQRNYAWGEKEISTLINDIENFTTASNNGNEYFLGSVVFFDRGKEGFEVIDGQQRLTTLYLLFTYLITYFGSDKSIKVDEGCLVYSSRPGYKKTLESLRAGDEKQYWSDEGSESLLAGYRYLNQIFGNGIDKYYPDTFLKKLDNVVLFMIEVPKDTDLNHYFEIMNTRGEQLEQHEVLKSRMYSQLKDPKEKALFAKIWDSCSNMGKYIQKAFKPEERSYIFGDNWENFLPTNFDDLQKRLPDPDNDSNDQEPKSIFAQINENEVKNDGKKNEDEIIDDFQPLIKFPTLLLHCKNIIDSKKGGNENDGYLNDEKLLDYFPNEKLDKTFLKDYAYTLLKAKYNLDNFIIHRETDAQAEDDFSLKRVHKTGGDNLTPISSFSKTSDEDDLQSDDDTYKVRMIQSCLRVSYTSPKQMYWITELLRSLVDDKREAENVIKTCENYLSEKVMDAISNDDSFVRAYQELPRYVYFYLDYLLWRDGYDCNGIKLDDNYIRNFKFLFRSPIDHFVHLEDGESYSFDETPGASQWKHSFGNLSCITTGLNFSVKSNNDINFTDDQLLQSPKLYIMAKIKKDNDNEYNETKAEGHCKKMKEILENRIRGDAS